jgi:hypothetical protein
MDFQSIALPTELSRRVDGSHYRDRGLESKSKNKKVKKLSKIHIFHLTKVRWPEKMQIKKIKKLKSSLVSIFLISPNWDSQRKYKSKYEK